MARRALSIRYADATGLAAAELAPLTLWLMGYPTVDAEFVPDFASARAGTFIVPALLGFLAVIFAYQLVAEKEAAMRELMSLAGLRRLPFWAISWLYGYTLYLGELCIYFAVTYGANLKLVSAHNPGVMIITYLLYAAAMTSYACFTSTLFSSRWLALTVGFFVLVFVQSIIGAQLSDRWVSDPAASHAALFFICFVPTFGLAYVTELSGQTGTGTGQGRNTLRLSWSNIGWDSDTPLAIPMVAFAVGMLGWALLALWCDIVLPIGPGLKDHPLFCLRPLRCLCRRDAAAPAERPPPEHEAEEVAAERARAASAQPGGVRALGLIKRYPGAARHAVVNMQLAISESECFGLLGSNGAGKTTTIHMLSGLLPATAGEVLVAAPSTDGGEPTELSIRHDADKIHSAMGVCSQENLLWDDLTGAEHLWFFARLRRLGSAATIRRHVAYWLERVSLSATGSLLGLGFGAKPARTYSGGMKRRLGVANALIGNPRLVYLDEPSTGLDPESRQQLWTAVLDAKPSKSIILTTHALEEAEVLCDRVGIMTHGVLRTLGTPRELRARFDTGYKLLLSCELLIIITELLIIIRYKLLLSCEPGRRVAAQVDRYVLGMMPGARLTDSVNGVRTYIVPKEGMRKAGLFRGMAANKRRLRIKEWGLSNTTLEEVFLGIVAASPADAESSRKP
jgi:ABC-type multidrug transport system ATPase subunit